MGKIIQIEVPDWVDEKAIKKVIYELIEESKVVDDEFLTMLKELSEKTKKDKNVSEILEEMRK